MSFSEKINGKSNFTFVNSLTFKDLLYVIQDNPKSFMRKSKRFYFFRKDDCDEKDIERVLKKISLADLYDVSLNIDYIILKEEFFLPHYFKRLKELG
jgi:hypothetical protein